MFTQISWGHYFTFVLFILTLYYLFICFRFYRDDIMQLISGKKPVVPEKDTFQGEQQKNPLRPDLQKIDLERSFEKLNPFQVTRSLSDEIQAYLNEAGRHSFPKEDILRSLKQLVSKYPTVKDSAFYPVIQDIIKTECETNCSIHLGEEELSGLWQVGGVF